MKWFHLLPALWLASCGSPGGPPVTDMTPVGEGLKLIGYALVAVSVVFVLGSLLRPPPSP